MDLRSFLLCWLLIVPAIADTTIGSLFEVNLDNDANAGCKSRAKTLETWLSESKALVEAGLKVFSHAENESNDEYSVAVRYLKTYFNLTPGGSGTSLVKGNLQKVQKFLQGTPLPSDQTPRMYCHDTWLKKLRRTDSAFDGDSSHYLKRINEDGSESEIPIEDVLDYRNMLWQLNEKDEVVSNGFVPYWSEELKQYVFDSDYGGKTPCTSDSVGTAQDMTTPSTITLCPLGFSNTAGGSVTLGSKTPKNKGITDVLSRSVTFYHELFHLVLGSADTPDTTYDWEEMRERLDSPKKRETTDGPTNEQLIRQNPETYVFFSVGYWFFLQQSKWGTDSKKRWSFQSGSAELVAL